MTCGRKPKLYQINGQHLTLKQIWAVTGIRPSTIISRLHSGLSIEDAVSRPLHVRKPKGSINGLLFEHAGRKLTIKQWSEIVGLSRQLVYLRLSSGWTIEQALATPTPRQCKRGVVNNFDHVLGNSAGLKGRRNPQIERQP